MCDEPPDNFKNKLVNFIYNIFDRSNVSNKTLGSWVKAFHFTAPFGALASILITPKLFALIALISTSFAALLVIIFKGCFLSNIEHRLTGDKTDNITNIFLEYLNMEVNKKNQIKITYYILFTYMPLLYFIYYYRFFVDKTIAVKFNKIQEKLP